MAEEIVCPVCEAVNAPENETCVECGADLASQVPADSDDPSMADTPAGGSEFASEHDDFEDPEAYAAQDIHDDPGDVEIESAPSAQIVNEEPLEDEFNDEEAFDEFGEPAQVDDGEFPVDDFDDEEFGDEEDLYEDAATDPEIQALGAAPEHGEGDELAQEAADEFGDDAQAEFDDADEAFDPDAEFDDVDDDSLNEEFSDFEETDSEAYDLEPVDELEEDFDEDFDEAEDDGLEEPSEQEPPELAIILNPQREGAEDLAELPSPGPYTEPATLTLFADRQHVGDLAVSANVLTLGLPEESDDDEAFEDELAEASEPEEPVDPIDDPGTVELDDELIEEAHVDPMDDDDLYDDDIQLQGGGIAPADAEMPDDEFEDEFAEFEDADEAEASEVSEISEVSEVSEISEVSEVTTPEDDGDPVLVDLGQYADADVFARQHSYIFRQNKNYTLYVTSNAGTQLNDEVLELGEHRELSDGDVIVLGGTLAMRFDSPPRTT